MLKKLVDKAKVSYIVYGDEVAPKTGTQHIQGYMWLSSQKRKADVIRLLRKGVFVGVPGKDKPPSYWSEYCQKDKTNCVEWGIMPTEQEHLAQVPAGQGTRCDLLELKRKIDDGALCDDLIEQEDHFSTFVVHKRFFVEYQAHKRRRLDYHKPQVYVLHGSTGTSKTKTAYAICGGYKDVYTWQPGNGDWFDGYQGQDYVIIDEYRGQFKYATLLNLLDGYPNTRVQVKNGFVLWSPKVIVITAPTDPHAWYPNLDAKDSLAQLMRRVTDVYDLDEVEGKTGAEILVHNMCAQKTCVNEVQNDSAEKTCENKGAPDPI